MTRKDKIYMSFLEHEIFTEKYDLDIDDLPKKVTGPSSNLKIIDTLRLLIKTVELDKSKTNKEIVDLISKSLNA